MNKKLISVLLMLITAFYLFAVEYIDVVKTKDGNIYKGIIIENKIDQYIKIELSGGSTFKIAYSKIDSIFKEELISENLPEKGTVSTTDIQIETQQVVQPKTSDIPSIRFTPKKGLFSYPYYTYKYSKYPIIGGAGGYIRLAQAIESSVKVDSQLQILLDDYSQHIKTARIITWSGIFTAVAGTVWYFNTMQTSMEQNLDSSEAINSLIGPFTMMIGGLIIELIGVSKAEKKPNALVSYYNSNYP